MEEITFEIVENILQSQDHLIKNLQKQNNLAFYYVYIFGNQEALAAIVQRKGQQKIKSIRDFFKYLNEEKFCHINIDNAFKHLNQIEFIICKEKKVYNINPDRKAYVIVGKALSVYKRVKKNRQQLVQDRQLRESLTVDLQKAIFKLLAQNSYPLQKWQKSYSMSDILLQFDLPQANLQPIYLGNQVFSPFVPIGNAVIMTIPSKQIKHQNLQFLKVSMLHVYIDYANALNKIMSKQQFQKNSKISGINFVEEGQVQVKSGRIVARGWVTNGHCKNSGFGWKFKPLNFIKFIGRNQNVWKQYLNDIKNNNELPFDISNILEINQQDDPIALNMKNFYARHPKKAVKLPKLNQVMSNSFDHGKYIEIQKMRHYDQKQMIYFITKEIYL